MCMHTILKHSPLPNCNSFVHLGCTCACTALSTLTSTWSTQSTLPTLCASQMHTHVHSPPQVHFCTACTVHPLCIPAAQCMCTALLTTWSKIIWCRMVARSGVLAVSVLDVFFHSLLSYNHTPLVTLCYFQYLCAHTLVICHFLYYYTPPSLAPFTTHILSCFFIDFLIRKVQNFLFGNIASHTHHDLCPS